MFYPASAEQEGLRCWTVSAKNLDLPLEFEGELLGVYRQTRGTGHDDHWLFRTRAGKFVHHERRIRFDWGSRGETAWVTVHPNERHLRGSLTMPPKAWGAFGWRTRLE